MPELTVGELRKRIEGLPDTTPVYYQRIEDFYFAEHGWTTTPLPWERVGETSDYIGAFSAHPNTDAAGETVFCINAHY